MTDPVTFEIVKHRLWQINDEQGIAIMTISASPIVVEGNDFNVGLPHAMPNWSTSGIGSLVYVTTMGDALSSIIDGGESIEDGDIFMTNDLFLGALHQNDVMSQVLCSVTATYLCGSAMCCIIRMSAAAMPAASASTHAPWKTTRRGFS